MSTLHEENITCQESEEEHVSESRVFDTCVDKKPTNCETDTSKPGKIPSSQSLNELQPRLGIGAGVISNGAGSGSPSIVSSGYGSQAASSSNLSSEDSLSIKSISVDETPETETNAALTDIDVTVMALTQPQTLNLDSLLSPPDVSLQSISPGKCHTECP